jgi:protoheme IX farnesyltransferase
MRRFRDFLALIKIGIVASNTLTALAGFVLASAWLGRSRGLGLDWRRGGLVLAGMALLVAGVCAINNWLDRDIDALMPRTRNRPTARGAIGAAGALGLGSLLGLAGLGLLLGASHLAAALALVAASVYLGPYTLWSKRRGNLSLYIGGIAGALPPLIGWAAAEGRLGDGAWLLFAFLALWQQAHVRALALKRADEYRGAGIPMAGLSPSRTEGENGIRDEGRARLAVLFWVAAALPLPALTLGLSYPSPQGLPLAIALGTTALGLGWLGLGLASLRKGSFAARMFAASLAYLVLVFCALLALGL